MSRQSALPEIIIASLNIGERRADYTPTTLSTVREKGETEMGEDIRKNGEHI